MEITFAENIKIEINLPIKGVESFQYIWKTDSHARLHLIGYMDLYTQWNPVLCYDSNVKIWRVVDEKIQILFQGCITGIEITSVGRVEQVSLEVTSASCQLDRQKCSCSFQNPKMTYGEAVRQAVQNDGGQVIRNQENDKEIKYPVIRNEETVWQFAERMAGRLGVSIIPDIETGRPNLWFGMRKGKEVVPLSEDEYMIELLPIGKKTGIRFQVKGQILYKIGDFMTFLGQRVTITEVEGYFNRGEFFFLYTLENMTVSETKYTVNHPAGEGYWGIISEVKEESIRLALDIDHGENAEEYFYPWNPTTGNVLYAMPENGERALLYFYQENQQDGAVIHCLNRELEDKRNFKDKAFDIQGGNLITLFEEIVNFSKGNNHKLSLSDDSISAMTVKNLKISAEGRIRLKAEQISIETPEELDICQG